MKGYYVYILASERNGTLYTGITSNLIKRIWEHKNKAVSGFTSKYNVCKLVYFEEFQDINLAISREKLLIPIPITGQTDGQRWKKSHNEVSKIARFKWH